MKCFIPVSFQKLSKSKTFLGILISLIHEIFLPKSLQHLQHRIPGQEVEKSHPIRTFHRLLYRNKISEKIRPKYFHVIFYLQILACISNIIFFYLISLQDRLPLKFSDKDSKHIILFLTLFFQRLGEFLSKSFLFCLSPTA